MGFVPLYFKTVKNTVNLLVKFEKAAYFVDRISSSLSRMYNIDAVGCILENRPHTWLGAWYTQRIHTEFYCDSTNPIKRNRFSNKIVFFSLIYIYLYK